MSLPQAPNRSLQSLPSTSYEASSPVTPSVNRSRRPCASVIRVNNDDDNGNQVPDQSDASTVTGEDDLARLTLTYPQDVKPGAKVTLTAPSNLVAVWTGATR